MIDLRGLNKEEALRLAETITHVEFFVELQLKLLYRLRKAFARRNFGPDMNALQSGIFDEYERVKYHKPSFI